MALITIDLGSIELTFHTERSNGKLWIAMPDGEGMEVNEADLEKLLLAYFKETH